MRDEGEECVLETLQLRVLDVAHLEHHLSASRNDAGLAGLDVDRAGGPDAAGSRDLRETHRDRRGEFDERDPGVLALDHACRARVIGLADENDAILPDADDAGDNAKPHSRLVERVALFDMGLEIADGVRSHDRFTPALRKTRGRQRLAKRRSVIVVARFVDLFVRDIANKGAASKKRAKVPFLIRPGRDVDCGAGRLGIFAKGARDFQSVNDAKRPVEPARMVLGLGVRADQELGASLSRTAEHVADPVDRRFEPGLSETAGEPAARFDILRRQRRSMHAAFVSAELGETAEVGEQSVAIDLRHLAVAQSGLTARMSLPATWREARRPSLTLASLKGNVSSSGTFRLPSMIPPTTASIDRRQTADEKSAWPRWKRVKVSDFATSRSQRLGNGRPSASPKLTT